MRKLVIIGAGGHGKVVSDCALKVGNWSSICFLDDNDTKTECNGFKVVGKVKDINNFPDDTDFFIAIGDNAIRRVLVEMLISEHRRIVTLIHPSSIIGINVSIGRGSLILAGVVINSCTKIGEGCILNTASTIDHDNVIGDYVHVCPGAHLAGNVKIGQLSWLGIGTIVSNNVEIAERSYLGAGCVVIRDLFENGKYVGVPARRIE